MSEHTTQNFAEMSNEDLDAFITASVEKGATLVASYKAEAPTLEQVRDLTALRASVEEAKAEKDKRKKEDEEAAEAFKAAAEAFAPEAEEEVVEASAEEEVVEAAADEAEEPAEEEAPAEEAAPEVEAETTTASAAATRKVDVNTTTASLRQTVSAGQARPEPAASTAGPVLVASANVRGFSSGQVLDGAQDLAKAMIARAEGFRSTFSASVGQSLRDRGINMQLSAAHDVASLQVPFSDAVTTASAADGYAGARAANAERGVGAGGNVTEEFMTAGGWCAPSEQTYNYITDYVVDGLVQIAEAPAPRGGIKFTRGPQKDTSTATAADFGFDQTEAEAIARKEKECEVITCPPFEEIRLDAMGYCVKIPLLTQAAYPELIADSLQMAQVMYAHKRNGRTIADMVAASFAVDATNAFGATFTDALEALSQIAVAQRRKWNVGVNAVLEVVLPQVALDIFLADMSRRNNAPIDTVRKSQIDAHFRERGLRVQYVADWQDLTLDLGSLPTGNTPLIKGDAPAWPDTIKAMIYPAGTFTRFTENVANISAVYDAASLSINEYTGVFFEQGYALGMLGYESVVVEIPTCVAGRAGALDLTCVGSGSI